MTPGFKLTRYETKALRYDNDFGNQFIIRIRINKDQNGVTRTPVTPLLVSRLLELNQCNPPRARSFEPRNIEACFRNALNETGESNLVVFVPYRPLDGNHNLHIKEIAQSQDVRSIVYRGEDSEKR